MTVTSQYTLCYVDRFQLKPYQLIPVHTDERLRTCNQAGCALVWHDCRPVHPTARPQYKHPILMHVRHTRFIFQVRVKSLAPRLHYALRTGTAWALVVYVHTVWPCTYICTGMIIYRTLKRCCARARAHLACPVPEVESRDKYIFHSVTRHKNRDKTMLKTGCFFFLLP